MIGVDSRIAESYLLKLVVALQVLPNDTTI